MWQALPGRFFLFFFFTTSLLELKCYILFLWFIFLIIIIIIFYTTNHHFLEVFAFYATARQGAIVTGCFSDYDFTFKKKTHMISLQNIQLICLCTVKMKIWGLSTPRHMLQMSLGGGHLQPKMDVSFVFELLGVLKKANTWIINIRQINLILCNRIFFFFFPILYTLETKLSNTIISKVLKIGSMLTKYIIKMPFTKECIITIK